MHSGGTAQSAASKIGLDQLGLGDVKAATEHEHIAMGTNHKPVKPNS